MNFQSGRLAWLAGVAVVAMVPGIAHAQSQVAVSLPEQTLSESLRQLALQSGREILFAPNLVANRRAAPLRGSFAPRDAVQRLVAPHGLVVEEAAPNVFVIKRRQTPRATTIGADRQQFAAPAVLSSAGVAAQFGQTAPSESGQGVISGVVSGPDGNPVAGAIVRIAGTNLSTVTDANGHYRISGVPAGSRTVVVNYLGDEPAESVVNIAEGRETSVPLARNAGQEIVVLGYAGSIQRALNQQKNAPNSATVVSADLLGQFPAETVSEALRRVPGVGFGRADDRDEGSRITVRGFTSEAIQIQMNGLELQGTGFERTIDLSGFLADNISEIRIEKSLLPSHESTGSGGLVKIETKSGLDYGRMTLNLGFETEFGGDPEFGGEWQAGAIFGKKLTDNFGIAASISYRETDRRNYDAAITGVLPPVLPAGFTGTNLIPESMDFPYDPEITDRLITSASYSQRDRRESNLLASINLAWDVAGHTRLRLDAQRNQRDGVTNTARSTMSFLTASFDMPIPELGGEVRRRSTLSSLRPNLGLGKIDLKQVSDTIGLRGDTRLGAITLDYKVGFARATSKSNNININILGTANTSLSSILSPNSIVINNDDDAANTPRVVGGAYVFAPNGLPVPSLSAAGQAYILNPANYYFSAASVRNLTDSKTDAWTLELNAKYDFAGFVDYLKVGGKFDRSQRFSADDLFATTTVGGLATVQSYSPISGRTTTLADLGPYLVSGSLDRIGGGDVSIPFLINPDGIMRRLESLTVDDPATAFNEQRFNFNDFLGLDPIENSSALDPARTTETRWAGYLEGHFKLGAFDMIAGARYERITRVGTTLATPIIYQNLPGAVQEPRTTFIAEGLVGYNDTGGTADKITPSVLINFRPDRNTVARFHYNMSTTNPDFQLVRRAMQVVVDNRPTQNRAYIREANPDIKAQQVHNFEIGIARYFDKPAGVIGANFFYKITKNNFTNVFFEDAENSTVRDRILDYFGPLTTSRPDLFQFNDQTRFQLNRPSNGEGGTVWGVEGELIKQLDFLPGFLGNFGVMGNITYTTGDFPTLVSGRTDTGALATFTLNKPLAEASALVYNASLNYASGGFEGRLIYTHQDASVPDGGYNPNDLNTIVPDYSTLDLRLSYRAKLGGKLVTIFFEGDDLLRGPRDADIRRAIAPAFDRDDVDYYFPTTMQFNGGRNFTLGIRANF